MLCSWISDVIETCAKCIEFRNTTRNVYMFKGCKYQENNMICWHNITPLNILFQYHTKSSLTKQPFFFTYLCYLFLFLFNHSRTFRKDAFIIRNGWNLLNIKICQLPPIAWFLHGHPLKYLFNRWLNMVTVIKLQRKHFLICLLL